MDLDPLSDALLLRLMRQLAGPSGTAGVAITQAQHGIFLNTFFDGCMAVASQGSMFGQTPSQLWICASRGHTVDVITLAVFT